MSDSAMLKHLPSWHDAYRICSCKIKKIRAKFWPKV